jgi:pyridoxine 4-dehydrogenase
MAKLDAGKAGTFDVGDKTKINRLGFGAMRVTSRPRRRQSCSARSASESQRSQYCLSITGPGVWGEPTDRAGAIRTLRRLPEVGVTFIDTANSYGPDVSEMLIREALHPYPGILVATKAGFTRSGPNQWNPKGDPDYLIAEAKRSCEKLGVRRRSRPARSALA